jgi:hypothetical protein
VLLDSPTKPGKESLPPRVNASLLINWLNSPQLERTSCSSEAPEIEKPRDISVSTQVKGDHTPLPESDQKVDISKEPEAEDDFYIFKHSFNLFLFIHSLLFNLFMAWRLYVLLIDRPIPLAIGIFGSFLNVI